MQVPFHRENEKFICKTAENMRETGELIEKIFEYVCEILVVKLFRKR